MINIYIGENGSGKSRHLAEIAMNHIRYGDKVIAIANTFNDKFPRRNPRKPYHYMGSRLGKNVSVYAVKEAFLTANMEDKGDRLLSSLFRILEYTGYRLRIGFVVTGFAENIDELLESYNFEEQSEFRFHRQNLKAMRANIDPNYGGVYWIDDYSPLFSGSSNEAIFNILYFEKFYRKLKILKSVEIVLEKDNHIFSFKGASSGELSLISTAVFIASKLDDTSEQIVILIDEPENSLHPDWQRRYIQNIKDLFPYYNMSFHIATHSPMLIAGVSEEPYVQVYRNNGEGFIPVESKIKNIEDAYMDQFGIVTPQNNALSERCIDIINLVEWGDMTKSEAYNKLSEYKNSSYDRTQEGFINGVFDIVKNLEVNNG